jgi:hypothetical protein
MIGRRALLQLGALPLLSAPWLAACGTDPRPEDVAHLIRDGDFDAARKTAEELIARGEVDGQMPLLAGALALQAGDFIRAGELFRLEAPTATAQSSFASGMARTYWLQLAALRAGGDITLESAALLGLEPVGGAISGKLSPDAFVETKIAEARRIADVTILSIQHSTGRTAMLDHVAREDEQLYRCTGNFIAGERALATDDRDGARQFLTAAIDAQAPDLLEFHIAKAELAKLT